MNGSVARLHSIARHLAASSCTTADAAAEIVAAEGTAAAAAAAADVAREVRLAEDELRFYNAHGFLYLPAVVDSDACDMLREEVLEVCEKDPGINLTHQQLLDGSARDGDMLRQSAMHTKEQLLYSLRNSPNLMKVASQLVDGEAMLYNGFTAVKGAGGGGLFDLHQDSECDQLPATSFPRSSGGWPKPPFALVYLNDTMTTIGTHLQTCIHATTTGTARRRARRATTTTAGAPAVSGLRSTTSPTQRTDASSSPSTRTSRGRFPARITPLTVARTSSSRTTLL
jgi:hypothetical protein